MLALDTETQEQWVTAEKREKLREERQKALTKEILSNTVSIEGFATQAQLLDEICRNALPSTEVQRRLLRCNPNFIFVVNPHFPKLTGIYIERPERNAAGGWDKKRFHICGMESGINPEKTYVHTTKIRVPNPDLISASNGQQVAREACEWMEIETYCDETRGWRSVLLRLMKIGLITRADVEREFGWSFNWKKWHEQTENTCQRIQLA